MSAATAPIAPPPSTSGPVTARPTFFKALRAVWLFTWRSQLTWSVVPLNVLILFALPFLIYLTTSGPDDWARRNAVLKDPTPELNRFAHHLQRSGDPLKPEQRDQLAQIFTDEFAAAETALADTDASPVGIERRQEIVRHCYNQINDRVQPILDKGQFSRFQREDDGWMAVAVGQAGVPPWKWTEPFYRWLVDIYFFVILPLNCVRSCGGLIRDELQTDTLSFLTTRPVSRARLIVVKYLAQTGWLQIVMLIETLMLFGAGALRDVPSLGTLLPLFLAAQILAVPAWSALGTFLGLVTKRYMAFGIVYGLIVEMGIGRIPTNINTLSLMRHLKTLLAHNDSLNEIFKWTGAGVPFSVFALIAASFIFAGLAACLFTYREYHHTAEMQK
jgi:hypothetical protein